ncbi:MAG: hypothetical protein RIQ89_1190 [Bacteroidota bacterium]|jgi:NADH-quinone oxidoreductase subunit L
MINFSNTSIAAQLLLPILLAPLLGFLTINWWSKSLKGNAAGYLASGCIGISFLLSLFAVTHLVGSQEWILTDWINAGDLNIPIGLFIDQATAVMLLIITGVGFLIHLYAIGYMHDDERVNNFFGYLNLFIFFMLLLVMGNNFLLMFAGWEGVGLCSYLLIGFWFKNSEYVKAANKAFIMNRIGDLGFLLGMILIFLTFGSLNYSVVFESAKDFPSGNSTITAICILLFIGAMGKSAQIPLYTWLPDAMAGPTPVSALIHAATMVTAGIYMIVRSNVLYSLSPMALDLVMYTGVITALWSGTIALAQTDIKKVLAYSTVSQLGYMFAALGAGAYASGLFHVMTHAFFKALLFLAAGSVIHAMSGEQDIRKMGGLKSKIPVTHFVFLIGTLAITGVPLLSGFFSKDEILASVWLENKFLFSLLAITSVMTAVYMFRLYWLTFYGQFRGSAHQADHLHESPKVMTIPLIILAVLSIVGGYAGLPEIISHHHLLKEYLAPLLSTAGSRMGGHPSHVFEYTLLTLSVFVLLMVILSTRKHFTAPKGVPKDNESELSILGRILYRKYYIDELYETIIINPIKKISAFLYNIIDRYVIDGIVNGFQKIMLASADGLKYAQSGNIGTYIFAMVFGVIAILIFNMFN